MTTSQIEEIKSKVHQCLRALAGVCDGASSWDRAGYNKVDAGFGRQLAGQATLSDGQALAAIKMLTKYQNQLSHFELTVPDYNEAKQAFADALKGKKASIELDGNLILVKFPGRPEKLELDKVREFPGRYWAPDQPGQPWVIQAKFAGMVVNTYKDDLAYMISAEVIELANSTPVVKIPPAKRLDLIDGKILVYFNGRPADDELARIKSLSERKWEPDLNGKPWSVATRLIVEVASLFPEFAQTDTFAEETKKMQTLADMSRKADSNFDVKMKGGELLPFQRAGVEFLETAGGRAIIGDEMGLGKTIQELAYLQLHPELRPALLVVPASLKLNWKRETEKWLSTDDTIEILSGQKPYPVTGSIIIINYDILTYWVKTLLEMDIKHFCADEAHYMKNNKSLRTKAGKSLARKIDSTILLSGTPLTNRPQELFPLLNMVDPKAWGNFMRFAQQYCGAYNNGWGWDFTGATNLEELHEKIKPYMVRRVKKDVMKELPPKRRSTVVIEFDEKVRAEYEDAMEAARRLVGGTQAEHLAIIEKAKQCAVKGKLHYAIDWIENFLDTNGKLVVFCTHNMTVDTLMDKFGDRAVKVTGSVTGEARQAAVDAFQNDDNIRLFVGNIKAAGVGLTLTAASDVVFLEFAWTPGDMEQAIDRCHRIGQHDSVTAWYLVAENTIDEPIANLLQEKAENIHAVLDGENVAFSFGILNELVDQIKKMEVIK